MDTCRSVDKAGQLLKLQHNHLALTNLLANQAAEIICNSGAYSSPDRSHALSSACHSHSPSPLGSVPWQIAIFYRTKANHSRLFLPISHPFEPNANTGPSSRLLWNIYTSLVWLQAYTQMCSRWLSFSFSILVWSKQRYRQLRRDIVPTCHETCIPHCPHKCGCMHTCSWVLADCHSHTPNHDFSFFRYFFAKVFLSNFSPLLSIMSLLWLQGQTEESRWREEGREGRRQEGEGGGEAGCHITHYDN